MIVDYKFYNCQVCGHMNRIPKTVMLLKYVLFNKKHQYYKCNHCQTVHSFFIYSNIVKDNADARLKEKNEVKIKKEWRNP